MIRGGAALLVTAAVVVAAPAAAHAERWTGTDARRDVVATTYDPEPKPCGTVTERAAPRDTDRDITRLSVLHARDAVRITVHFRDLTRVHPAVQIAVVTPHRSWWVVVGTYRGYPWPHQHVETDLVRLPEKPPVPDKCGNLVLVSPVADCPGLTTKVSTTQEVLAVLVPRTCLRRPSWVRVGATAYGARGDSVVHDTWDPSSAGSGGPIVGHVGPRVAAGRRDVLQKGLPSKDSRVTNSATGLRRSFVISRTGLPSGTTAASAN